MKYLFLAGFFCMHFWGCRPTPPPPEGPQKPDATVSNDATATPTNLPSAGPSAVINHAPTAQSWTSLFNGRDLSGWERLNFGGEGDITVETNELVIGSGVELTGLKYTNSISTIDYEVELEAKRSDGSDFFCGLTFPVLTNNCTLIVGGWGGGVVGISSIDHFDASENETTMYIPFEDRRWYKIRLRVTREKLQVWIDDEIQIDQGIEGRHLSMRTGDVEMTVPFGLCTWQTKANLRNIRFRDLE